MSHISTNFGNLCRENGDKPIEKLQDQFLTISENQNHQQKYKVCI